VKIEKYIPKRINKDGAPDAIDRGGTRSFLPGDLLDAVNCRYYGHGLDGVVKNIMGNTLVPYTLGTGRNKVIGRLNNYRDNTLIFFIFNSTGDHRIVEYSPDTNAFIDLLADASLNFDENHPIVGGGVIEDNVIYNDAFNSPRSFNLAKAKANEYAKPYSPFAINLAAKPPLNVPFCQIASDSSVLINKITTDTWQFTHRYIYFDNRQSAFGPVSPIVYLGTNYDPSDLTNNVIRVSIEFPPELIGIVKNIQMCARKGNSGAYNIFYEIKNPTTTEFLVNFTNSGTIIPVADNEQVKLYDAIPDVTDALEIIKNRIFCPLNKTGFDVDESSIVLQVGLQQKLFRLTHSGSQGVPFIGDTKELFCKVGGIYDVGVIYYDDFGRASFAKKKTTVTVPFVYLNTQKQAYRNKITWQLQGGVPPGAKKYSICVSANQNQATYLQCEAVVHWYTRDITANEKDNTAYHDRYNWRGKRFLQFTNPLYANGDVLAYLQVPLNIPFVPDKNCIVKLPDGFPVKTLAIEGVIGDFIVVRMTAALKSYLVTTFTFRINIELFTLKETNSSKLYEIGGVFDIVNGHYSVTSGVLEGDTYSIAVIDSNDSISVDNPNGRYYSVMSVDHKNDDGTNASVTATDPPQASFLIGNHAFVVESPSGIFDTTLIKAPIVTGEPLAVNEETTSDTPIKTLDYKKSAWSIGRAHTVNTEEKRKDIFSTFGFSEPYIQQTLINGLNSFDAENQYTIGVERGRTRCLKRAGQVLIAIHEREASSLYIGEGVIRQNNDFILAKTDSVVGDDRKLQKRFGTINPESVLEVDDDLYWWDGYKGAIVRYTLAGMNPISDFGMKNYFYQKGQALFPYRNQIKVVTAYDYFHNEFIITFPDVKNGSGTVIIPGETWSFNTKENAWTHRYSFIPEMYGEIGTNLYGFSGGALWKFNSNSVRNNFFGIQYDRRFRFVANPELGKDKKYLNVHIDGNIAADLSDDSFAPVRVYTKEGQESFIPAPDFELDGLKYTGPILKDINTPNIPTGKLALRSGDDIVSNYLEVEVINNRVDDAPCSQVNVVYKEEEFSV